MSYRPVRKDAATGCAPFSKGCNVCVLDRDNGEDFLATSIELGVGVVSADICGGRKIFDSWEIIDIVSVDTMDRSSGGTSAAHPSDGAFSNRHVEAKRFSSFSLGGMR
ncbi:hypothetical protein C9413_04530 [Rhizobium sp. SEMIA 4085]|nr:MULTISPECIES: hypothetical protein [Rhizobium]NNH28791.1 hypothetical protein [Rhizobium sp. SEMIA 4085]